MVAKHKRARMFIISLLIYIAAVSVGHSIYALSQIDALEKTNEFLMSEVLKFSDENLTQVKILTQRQKK